MSHKNPSSLSAESWRQTIDLFQTLTYLNWFDLTISTEMNKSSKTVLFSNSEFSAIEWAATCIFPSEVGGSWRNRCKTARNQGSLVRVQVYPH